MKEVKELLICQAFIRVAVIKIVYVRYKLKEVFDIALILLFSSHPINEMPEKRALLTRLFHREQEARWFGLKEHC